MKTKIFTLIPILLAGFAACSPETEPVPAPPAPACPEPAGIVEELVAPFHGEGTEGMVFGTDGQMYVATQSAVWRVAPDGSVTKMLEVQHAVGLGRLGDRIAVADFGPSSDADVRDGSVHLWDPASNAVQTAGYGIPNPNFVVPTPWDTLLVSDDFDDIVWEVSPDAATDAATIFARVPSPNGMAFLDENTLLAVSTFASPPHLYRMQVAGAAATQTDVTHAFGAGSTPDGVALDGDQGLYVALNVYGEVLRFATPASEPVLVSDEVPGVASMAFAPSGSDGWDACSLYATRLFKGGVVRISTGHKGP